QGKCLLFDDCFEHEVWNHSNKERVILLFDLWHPELDDEVRAPLTGFWLILLVPR
ncbi:unnamed protein product, partial [Discosporangium mesarthrocarpum]